MKPVRERAGFGHAFQVAAAEAQAAFGSPGLYLERYVESGRHVEVQVLGDGERVIHLGTRDCSIQRRYQKLLEEAPAPELAPDLRERMHEAAVAFAHYLRYRGLGTVEFLVDCGRQAFYFLEMNARIQVEHPVTEMICGIDLVAEQIRVAEGGILTLAQDDIRFSGHAIECRLNAEDWRNGFHPSPGVVGVAEFAAGSGIRVDTHMQAGAVVPPFYDSLLAKLIVHGEDRDAALAKLRTAIGRCSIEGVATTISMHAALLDDPEFARGGVDTAYFPRFLEQALRAGDTHG